MDPDDDAVERLSDIRDCTYERAHEICLLVHARQDDPKSTAHDIADALIYIRKKNLSDSVRSITKWARKVTDGRIDPERERPTSDMQHQASNITPSEDANSASDDASKDRPDIERFEGAEDDEAFINWIDRNRSWGFVLNLRGDDKNPTLHTARCCHLRTDPKEDKKSTTNPKLCSKDENALRKRVQKIPGKRLEYCSHCEV
jgi:hypothetical protein